MAEINDHIKAVNTKLQLLLKQNQSLQAENEQLKKAVATHTTIDIQQKETIAALKQEQLILKATLDTMTDSDKKEMEKKINGYIKNIDKCISLLSHKHSE